MSVIVNNFNYADYLGSAVDSCLAQDWPDTETVVVDDGSTDGSAQVIAGYEGRVATVLQENRGQAAAFAAGLAASSGEVVIFLDADDVLLPSAARVAVRAFEESPGVVKVSWPMEVIDGKGRPTGELHPTLPLAEGNLRRVVMAQGPDAYITPTNLGQRLASLISR